MLKENERHTTLRRSDIYETQMLKYDKSNHIYQFRICTVLRYLLLFLGP